MEVSNNVKNALIVYLFKFVPPEWRSNLMIWREIVRGNYDPEVASNFILDLRAHKGFVTKHFALKYPNAVIHAYEPNPESYKKLRRRVRGFRNVHTFNEAIAAQDGEVAFYAGERTVTASRFGVGKSIEVPRTSLQTALSRLGTPAFVKMDIEGAEYEVLEQRPAGMREIVCEFHKDRVPGLKNGLPKGDELLARFFDKISFRDGETIVHAI
jgi:FkbM family methyltransferase